MGDWGNFFSLTTCELSTCLSILCWAATLVECSRLEDSFARAVEVLIWLWSTLQLLDLRIWMLGDHRSASLILRFDVSMCFEYYLSWSFLIRAYD